MYYVSLLSNVSFWSGAKEGSDASDARIYPNFDDLEGKLSLCYAIDFIFLS